MFYNKLEIKIIAEAKRSALGSPKGPSDHRRPLKIADFQRSFLFDPPRYGAKY